MFLSFTSLNIHINCYISNEVKIFYKVNIVLQVVIVTIITCCLINNKGDCFCFSFCYLIEFFTSRQQSFSYEGTGLPELNQY